MELLTGLANVFNKDDKDIWRTQLVEHCIPIIVGTTAIRQPPLQFGPEKEEEAEKQVIQLSEQDFIKP